LSIRPRWWFATIVVLSSIGCLQGWPRGQDSVDWFFGFKRPVLVTDQGDLLACRLPPATADDRRPLEELTQRLFGKLVGDQGYLSQDLVARLLEQGQLLTPIKGSMQPRLVRLTDKLLLRKRVLIEPSNDQLKTISQIEHSRHRSPANFLVNVLADLLTSCHQPKKPSLQVTQAGPESPSPGSTYRSRS